VSNVSELEELFNEQVKDTAVERQYRFHPVRRWKLDFAYPQIQIAVEVDGGTWSKGRHTRGAGYEQDCEKLNTAAIMGWTVLRATGKMVKDGRARQALTDLAEARGVSLV